MNTIAVKELLYKMADDLLIIGHRNSEWTGLGPWTHLLAPSQLECT